MSGGQSIPMTYVNVILRKVLIITLFTAMGKISKQKALKRNVRGHIEAAALRFIWCVTDLILLLEKK